jgi:hypothetical protein
MALSQSRLGMATVGCTCERIRRSRRVWQLPRGGREGTWHGGEHLRAHLSHNVIINTDTVCMHGCQSHFLISTLAHYKS